MTTPNRPDRAAERPMYEPATPRELDDTNANPAKPARGHADRLRDLINAFRDLLATHAKQFRDLDREHHETLDRITGERDRAVAEADRRIELERRRLDEEIERTRDETLGRFDQKDRELRDAHRAKRSAVTQKLDQARRKADRALQESTWLAETVYESGEQQPRIDFEQTRGTIDGLLKELRSLEAAAHRLVYGSTSVPSEPASPTPPSTTPEDAMQALRTAHAEAADGLERLRRLPLPRFVRAGGLIVAVPLAAGAGLAVGGLLSGWTSVPDLAIGAGAGLAAGIALAVPATILARRQIRAAHDAWTQHAATTHALAVAAHRQAEKRRDDRRKALTDQRAAEIDRAREDHESRTREIREERERTVGKLDADLEAAAQRLATERDERLARVEERASEHRDRVEQQHAEATLEARDRFERETKEEEDRYRTVRRGLERTWIEGARAVREQADALVRPISARFGPWSDPAWRSWNPGSDPAAEAIPLGRLRIDAAELPGGLPENPDLLEGVPGGLLLPAALGFPGDASLLIEAPPDLRETAIATVQNAMLRLLVGLPPSKARFTLIDAVGLGQSLAGFMRLADSDPAIVGGRIWTEERHVEQRLTDLTEHMENVIQKYLRREFDTIEAYNEHAGEIAEPYRFLVIVDFPAGFNDASARRLRSILDSGPRCGVYTIITVDPDAKLPADLTLDELRARAIVLTPRNGKLAIAENGLADFPLDLDPPPDDKPFADIVTRVGAAAVDAGKVEVPFRMLAPADHEMWTASSAAELRAPIGRVGATKLQELAFGRGTSQHALVAGKTGSGKSTLLHVLITSLILRYAPEEIELYLVDFKKGVEFKTYAAPDLPHIRAVAIESDREFGLSVLQRLDEELKRRGDAFRELGVQSLGAFRDAAPDRPMPRVLLVIDEFQEFFVEDDRLAQEASLLLDRLVRQGRAFGMHVLLGSQTLSGAYTLARSTMGQMAVRIALQCSETDSYLILSEDNGAARLLSRPGEAIYNDSNGTVEGNNPFQTAWLPDRERDDRLETVRALARERTAPDRAPTIVFEGNAPADPAANHLLDRLLRSAPEPGVVPRAWIGEPVAIKDPTAAPFRRQSGSNLLVVGQQNEAARAIVAMATVSLAAHHRAEGPDAPRFYLVDGTPEEDPGSSLIETIAAALPHDVRTFGWRDCANAITEIAAALDERERTNTTDAPPIYLVLNALQRLRALRRKEDGFSFSTDDDAPASPDKQLVTILREGPGFGIFTVVWCDTAGNLTRALDRQALSEFDSRVLFQMSAADSSTLIESPDAARLGMQRALFYSEETGTAEKFRPYSEPSPAWLAEIGVRLRTRDA